MTQLNTYDKAEAKRVATALDYLLYPRYAPGLYTVAESQRIAEEHYGAIRNSDIIELLLESVRHGMDFARAYSAAVLGAIGDRRAIPLLVHALADTAPAVRVAASKGLRFFRDHSTVPALIRLLEDSSPEVRCSVASALGFIGCKDAVPALMEFYVRGDSKAKVSALHALGSLCDPRSLPLVRSALHDTNHKTRTTVKGALAAYDLKRRQQTKPMSE